MRKSAPIVLVFGILFLFFIQMAGTLVESIYITDLMSLNLDEKALGVLFFFTPLALLPFYRKYPRPLAWVFFGILLLARGLTPYLHTTSRILTSGIASGTALGQLFLILSVKGGEKTHANFDVPGAAGLALAIGLSVLLRVAGHGLDYALTPGGGWAGWGLGLFLGWPLLQADWESTPASQTATKGAPGSMIGVVLLLTLAWFAFSAPAVIARWTEADYTLIVMAISVLSIGWVWLSLNRPHFSDHISPRILVIWNLLFTLCLTSTILTHRVPFPSSPESPAVVVTSPSGLQQLPLALMLFLFPVIFLDMQVFLGQIRVSAITPRQLFLSILMGSTAQVLLVFAHIFTNVWGYIPPVSLPFRNLFWLPYFALAGGITVLIWCTQKADDDFEQAAAKPLSWAWTILLGAIFLGSVIGAWPAKRVPITQTEKDSVVVMTYNIQQANDGLGEKSYERQLALIRNISPDVLALQETDSARIALNNNDYVRYFAENLGYYAYYGPTTVTGTYGAAILSKYPLSNTRSIFSYSDRDEISTAAAEIEVNGLRITIYCVHPDGSNTAMLAFAKTLLEDSTGKPYVIALGDYNLTDDKAAYKVINGIYVNAWASVYPSNIGADGVDMSGEDRIDHIFISPSLMARNPVYVLPPASASDHPAHWAEIYWANR